MAQIVRLESVYQFNTIRGQKTLHPMVTILDQTKSKPVVPGIYLSDLYIVFFKDVRCESFKYGKANTIIRKKVWCSLVPARHLALSPAHPHPTQWLGLGFPSRFYRIQQPL
ncbi:MAG: hypothetical protein U0V54_10755 [Saprospiraceae bacterium]